MSKIDRGPSPANQEPWRISDSHGLCIVNQETMIADGYPDSSAKGWRAERDDFEAIVHRVNHWEAAMDRIAKLEEQAFLAADSMTRAEATLKESHRTIEALMVKVSERWRDDHSR